MFRFRPFPRHRQAADAADAAGSADATPAIDVATLDKLRELDPDGARGFVAQVLRTYEAALVRQLAGLGEAAAAGDVEASGRVAHTLKSSSASVGALGLSRCCASVERLAKAGDAAALGAPLLALRAEAERVLVAVRAMLPG